MQIAKEHRRLLARRGRDAAQGDRQEDPRADGVPEGQVPRGLRRERRHAGGRAAALEGHGAVAGLLLQQGARRLLRADRLPHRLAEGEPPVRVHGRADLVGDEHEGPRAVLRQRLPRARDRGAAARRELVADRLRRRRGQDPLRPERGQERGRGRGARDHRGARGGRAVRVDLGLHRARRPAGREQARARVARQVRRARLDRRHRARGCSPCSSRRSPGGRSTQADRLAGQGSIFDLGGPAEEEAESRPTHHPPSRPASSRSPSCCGSRRRRSASTSPSIRSHAVRDQLRRKTDCTLAELERRRDGEVVTVGGIVSARQAADDEEGRADGLPALDDLDGRRRGGRLQLDLRRRARPVRDRPDPRRQGPRRPQAGGRDEADRDGGDARSRPCRSGRRCGCRLDARQARAGIVRELVELVQDYPGDSPVFVSLETSMGPKTLALGPKHRVTIDSDFLTDARLRLGADAVL